MAISMGEATRTLQQMMPDMDPEVITSVLESHGGHMERAVESLLAMGAGSPPLQRPLSEDHSPSRHSMALSTPSQPMVSPGAVDQVCLDSPWNDTQSLPYGPCRSFQMDCDEMLAQSLQHEELIQAAEAHQEAMIGAYRNQSVHSTQQVGYNLAGAVQGVSNALTSMGSAAYRGLTSLVSSTPTFASCMPVSVRELDDRWGRIEREGEFTGSEPALPASSSRNSPWMDRGTVDAATPPQDMRMGGQAVSEDDRLAMAPSYTHLVHRRGHHAGGTGGSGPVAKKDD